MVVYDDDEIHCCLVVAHRNVVRDGRENNRDVLRCDRDGETSDVDRHTVAEHLVNVITESSPARRKALRHPKVEHPACHSSRH